MANKLTILLSPYLMERMANDNQPYYQKIVQAFEFIGISVDVLVDSSENIEQARASDGFVLTHLHHPIKAGALTARPTITYPFWTLENSANPIEKFAYAKGFYPDAIDDKAARGFHNTFKSRILGDVGPATVSDECVLVGLQGRLLDQRYWQSMSPINMLAELKAIETKRRILIKLHPNETLSDGERAAIDAICDARVEISDQPSEALLQSCAYTVSMNSTLSLKGLFAGKGGLLFGASDFHHMLARVHDATDIEAGIHTALEVPENYQKYLFWYFNKQMINVLDPKFHYTVLKRCKELGWDIAIPPQSDFDKEFA